MLIDKYHNLTVTAIQAQKQRRKLTRAIRLVLYLAAREAFDRSSNLHQRCNLIRLIHLAEMVLRDLVNRPSRRAS
jgi:hypothetical protein